jgi:hypothetical protein
MVMKRNILKQLQKLEKLEDSFTPEEVGRAMRHHAATGECPEDVSPRTVEIAIQMMADSAAIMDCV